MLGNAAKPTPWSSKGLFVPYCIRLGYHMRNMNHEPSRGASLPHIAYANVGFTFVLLWFFRGGNSISRSKKTDAFMYRGAESHWVILLKEVVSVCES